MRHFLQSSSHQPKHFGHSERSAPVCLCRTLHFVGALNALSNGKLNEFLVYALLLKVIHVFKSPDLLSALIFETGKQKAISLCVEFKSIPSALCPASLCHARNWERVQLLISDIAAQRGHLLFSHLLLRLCTVRL